MPADSFPVSGPIRSSVRIAVGEVTVTTDDGGHAHASVEPADAGDRAATSLAASATITFEAGELRVVVPERTLWRTAPAPLHVRLTLPPGSSLEAAAGVVTLTTTGRLDEISLKAGVATVDVEHAAALEARGGTATIELGSASRVGVKCGRADLRVGAVEDVYVKTGQGRVEIGSSSGDVLVKGAMVSLDLAAASGGQIRFEAAMGNAQVGVVEGTTVELDLSSATGDARSELQPTGEPDGREAGLRVRLRTTSGNVLVHRAAAQPASAAS